MDQKINSFSDAVEFVSKKNLKILGGTICIRCPGVGEVFIDGLEGKIIEHMEHPDCTLELEEQVLLDLICGKIDSVSAFLQGQISVEGSREIAMRLQALMG